jgi:hypothetical protein
MRQRRRAGRDRVRRAGGDALHRADEMSCFLLMFQGKSREAAARARRYLGVGHVTS